MRTGRQRPKLLLIIVAGFGLAAYARVNLFSHTVRVINRVPGSANEESSLRGRYGTVCGLASCMHADLEIGGTPVCMRACAPPKYHHMMLETLQAQPIKKM